MIDEVIRPEFFPHPTSRERFSELFQLMPKIWGKRFGHATTEGVSAVLKQDMLEFKRRLLRQADSHDYTVLLRNSRNAARVTAGGATQSETVMPQS